MRKTIHTHPFLVKVELPAGHPWGRKKRSCIRNSRHKTFKEAMREQQDIKATGSTIQLVYEGKLCIFNSTKMTQAMVEIMILHETMLHDFGARGLAEGVVMRPDGGLKGSEPIIKLKPNL